MQSPPSSGQGSAIAHLTKPFFEAASEAACVLQQRTKYLYVLSMRERYGARFIFVQSFIVLSQISSQVLLSGVGLVHAASVRSSPTRVPTYYGGLYVPRAPRAGVMVHPLYIPVGLVYFLHPSRFFFFDLTRATTEVALFA